MTQDRLQDPAVLLGLAMGTLNLTLILLLLVLALHLGGNLGDQLEGLSTVAGLGVFGLFWAIFVYATYRAMRDLSPSPAHASMDAVLSASIQWGARTGLIVFAGLVIVIAVLIAYEGRIGQPEQLLFAAIVFASIGSVASVAIGLAIGVLSGLVDFVLLALARRMVS